MVAVWLDDVRPMPDGFDLHFEDGESLINWLDNLKTIAITKMSFDHDLGDVRTGYDVAKRIEYLAYDNKIKRFEWKIHSANPVGVKNIRAAMQKAEKYWSFHEMFPVGYVGCANQVEIMDHEKQAEWKLQREVRGFDATETWNLDDTLFRFLYPRLVAIYNKREEVFTSPKRNAKIKALIDHLQPWYDYLESGNSRLYTELDTQVACKLLSKCIGHLWW